MFNVFVSTKNYFQSSGDLNNGPNLSNSVMACYSYGDLNNDLKFVLKPDGRVGRASAPQSLVH